MLIAGLFSSSSVITPITTSNSKCLARCLRFPQYCPLHLPVSNTVTPFFVVSYAARAFPDQINSKRKLFPLPGYVSANTIKTNVVSVVHLPGINPSCCSLVVMSPLDIIYITVRSKSSGAKRVTGVCAKTKIRVSLDFASNVLSLVVLVFL